MKILVLLVCALALTASDLFAGGKTAAQQVIKTNADAATPVRIAPAGTLFTTATFIGKKAARTANTGTVFIGVSSGNDTQPFDIATTETITITAPEGCYYDLYDWYIDVTDAGDGVVVIYTK